MFNDASSSQRKKSNAIFRSKKLEKSDNLVNAINNLTINDASSELNTATISDAQSDLVSDPDIVAHTSNKSLDENLLSCRTIREISVFPPSKKPRIAVIGLTP